MAWTNLPTDYADATWEGERTYTIKLGGTTDYENSLITDTTAYTPEPSGGNVFYGANDANQTNDAINKIVAAMGSDINNLSVGIAYGGTGASTAQGARTNLEVMKGTTIFANPSGTSNTITINQQTYGNITDYEFMDVFYKESTGSEEEACRRIKCINGINATLEETHFNVISSSRVDCYTSAITASIHTNSITFSQKGLLYYESGITGSSPDGRLVVTKIIAYKY